MKIKLRKIPPLKLSQLPGQLKIVTIDYPKSQRRIDPQTPELSAGTRVTAIAYERPNGTRLFYYQAFLRTECAKHKFSEIRDYFNQNSLNYYFGKLPLIVCDFSLTKRVF